MNFKSLVPRDVVPPPVYPKGADGSVSAGGACQPDASTSVLGSKANEKRPKLGFSVIGYTEPVRRLFGMNGPTLDECEVGHDHSSHGTIEIGTDTLGIQFDIAFKMSRDVRALEANLDQGSIASAISEISTCAVIISADGLACGPSRHRVILSGVVIGRRDIILDQELCIRVNVFERDRIIWDVSTRLMSPVASLRWAASKIASRGNMLGAEHLVTPGSLPFLFEAKTGQCITVEYGHRHRLKYDVEPLAGRE